VLIADFNVPSQDDKYLRAFARCLPPSRQMSQIGCRVSVMLLIGPNRRTRRSVASAQNIFC